ncbi:hypothetical protein GCM10022393_01190 [Aquimarina addita]|uniref:Uncharacterized protein n=1 Tax=Aquimarina addita TaxID=870485 RepID=A0ABP7X7J3_9FLAO
MNSNQEKVLNIISQFSFGAPFIFAPDEYKKGNATREPADLVYACNNTIFLIYAKQKNKPKKGLASEIIFNRRKTLIEDNIGQLEGWLREWKNGRNIIGKNEFGSFDISFGEYENVIGLGIINYTEDFTIFHKELATKLNLKHCLSISNDSFDKLFRAGFSLLDLGILIKSITLMSKDNIIPVNKLIDNYFSSSMKRSSKEKIDINILKETDIYFNNLKSQINVNKKSKELQGMSEILNDLKLYETIKIKYQISILSEKFKKDIRQWQIVMIPLEKYKIIIGFSAWQNWHVIIDHFIKTMKTYENDDGLIGMLYELNTLCPMVNLCLERKNKSKIEILLK